MPDTYTSQFSGEEIDSALRAAQIISGASTPAELRDKLEIRGDTIPVSATDPTPVSEALTASGGGINPNLLDNWFFGRPVNQRGGYYIPAGTKYNTLSWTEAGTTDKAYPVVGYSGQDPLINVNGTNYIVGKAAQIPGYCAAGYTVDRWYSAASTKTVQVANDHLAISDTGDYVGFFHRLEYESLLGKTVTFSVLAKRTAAGAQVPYITVMIGSGKFEGWGEIVQSDDYQLSSCTVTLSAAAPSEGYFFVDIVGMAGSSIDIKAAKLELGDQQTLAHKENGLWVLNEIPDYGEQLARCQRYYRRWTGADNKPLGVAVRRESKLLELVFSLNTAMRVAPSLTFNGSFVCVPTFTWCSVTSIDVATPDTVAIFLKPNDDVTFDLDAYQINIAHANEYIALSADL